MQHRPSSTSLLLTDVAYWSESFGTLYLLCQASMLQCTEQNYVLSSSRLLQYKRLASFGQKNNFVTAFLHLHHVFPKPSVLFLCACGGKMK